LKRKSLHFSPTVHLYCLQVPAPFSNIPVTGSSDFPSCDWSIASRLASLHGSRDADVTPMCMMWLPVDHQRHCNLSLLIMPHIAVPDYELPLLHWRFFSFFVCLPYSCQQEFHSVCCWNAELDRTFYRKGRCICTQSYNKAHISHHCLFLLPLNTPTCVCCKKPKHGLTKVVKAALFFQCRIWAYLPSKYC